MLYQHVNDQLVTGDRGCFKALPVFAWKYRKLFAMASLRPRYKPGASWIHFNSTIYRDPSPPHTLPPDVKGLAILSREIQVKAMQSSSSTESTLCCRQLRLLVQSW